MTRKELMDQLNISDDSPSIEVMEKLYSVAILPEGTTVVARVLKRYLNMKELYWGRIKEVK